MAGATRTDRRRGVDTARGGRVDVERHGLWAYYYVNPGALNGLAGVALGESVVDRASKFASFREAPRLRR
jgi:hypothetical protein